MLSTPPLLPIMGSVRGALPPQGRLLTAQHAYKAREEERMFGTGTSSKLKPNSSVDEAVHLVTETIVALG